MDFHIYFHGVPDLGLLARLDEINSKLASIADKDAKIMATLDQLVEKVAEVSGKVESMKVFVAGLEQQLADLLQGVVVPPAVQAKIDALFDQAAAQSQAITDAIDNDPNTPTPAQP